MDFSSIGDFFRQKREVPLPADPLGSMQAPPRLNKIAGFFADAIGAADKFARAPGGYQNPPVEAISDFFGVPAIQRTLNRISYGQSVTNAGKANVPFLPEDTGSALAAIAPAAAKWPRQAAGLASMITGNVPGDLERAVILAGEASKIKTVPSTVHPGSVRIPVKVNPRDGLPGSGMDFRVDTDGNLILDAPAVLAKDTQHLEGRVGRVVDETLHPWGADEYIRGARTRDDFARLKEGTHRGSTNHVTMDSEGGLSVGRAPDANVADYPYAYVVRGKRIGTGSDGEPLLDTATAKPVGKLQKMAKLEADYRQALRLKAQELGFDEPTRRAFVSGSFNFE